MMRRPSQSLLTLWAMGSLAVVAAFSPSAFSNRARLATTKLNVDGPPPGTKLVSNKKEVIFDGNRFYETGLEEEDCIPSQEYCPIDPATGEPIRLTVEEKERMFLDALQSYYVSGRQVMDDAEFDMLKEDLAWNGSEVVALNRKEMMYLSAMQAFTRGEPILSDQEFDALRDELKEEGSQIAVSKEPKCYIDTGICKATFKRDFFRSNLLYLPLISIFGIIWLGLGYEILGGGINPLILGALGLPVIITGAKATTDTFIFPDNLVAYGPCPSCGAENRVYFGDILGVEGFGKQASIKCGNCKEVINVQRQSLRASSLPKND